MNNDNVKTRGLIYLIFIFGIMLIMNSVTPLWADDYFAAFVWPDGVRMLGLLPEGTKRVSEYTDLLMNLKTYYLNWGGRIPGSMPVSFFVWKGKSFFNVINALMMTFLVAEIYWLTHKGIITSRFQGSYIIWIFLIIWTFNISFVDTCLWLSGSCNYLWMMVIVLAFLIPYVRNYYDINTFQRNKFFFSLCMFILGILAGWTHETSNCWIILSLAYLLYKCYMSYELTLWKISGFIGFCIGYAALILAPGNFSRLVAQQYFDSTFILDKTPNLIITGNILFSKVVEILVIYYVQIVLWYFVILFYLKYKKIIFDKNAERDFKFIKTFVIIAMGSNLLLLLTPSSALRPSFLSLVFLTISVVSIVKLLEEKNIFYINNTLKNFLKKSCYLYFIITFMISTCLNAVNWQHWNKITDMIKLEKDNSTNIVFQVQPYCTEKLKLSPFIKHILHLVEMPIYEHETSNYDIIFAKYCNIKGIKTVANEQ